MNIDSEGYVHVATNAGVQRSTVPVTAVFAPTLTVPANGATGVAVAETTFEYETSVPGSLTLEVAEDPAFTAPAGFRASSVSSSVVSYPGYYRAVYAARGTGLAPGRTYYWRVTNTSEGATSPASSFTTEADSPPAFTTTPAEEATEGQPYTYVAAASDPNGLAITFTAAALPRWLALVDNGNGTATLSGTPADADVGPHSVTLTASDGTLSTNQTFEITVDDVNNAPVAAQDTAETLEEIAVAVDVLANDTDADGDALTLASVEQPAHGTTSTDGATVTYTPAEDFVGRDEFTYVVSDGQLASVGTVVVTVRGRNDAPTATDDVAETDEDRPVVVEVLANDSDVDGGTSLTVTAVRGAQHGSTQINDTGTVTYTPAADFHGTDEFTYTIDDNSGPVGTPSARRAAATATVRVTVRPVNDAPGAPSVTAPASGSALTVAGGEGETVAVSWSAVTDVDGDEVTYRWELSASETFGTILLALDAPGTTTAVTYGALASALDAGGVGVGQSATVFHRAVASDKAAETSGPASRLVVTRGVVTNSEGAPTALAVSGAYPNPTAGRAAIRMDLPSAAEVRVDVYDLLGRTVAVVDMGPVAAGTDRQVWLDLSGLGPGVYAYRLSAASGGSAETATGRLTVAR